MKQSIKRSLFGDLGALVSLTLETQHIYRVKQTKGYVLCKKLKTFAVMLVRTIVPNTEGSSFVSQQYIYAYTSKTGHQMKI